ncbi:UDP-glucose 4-epimerase GalE [Billgrantia desiderata]|uniref:UDP-glucose 4-epimerase GalE n=1 Tax=Billgrantia desiderata TaxID=52021 RepID=UPI001C3C7833|nr:UDP-glucose 4-epimerase GalE [Halomonas desiderata]
MNMKILVVGGAGYIGSHMVKHLVLAGHEVVVLDDLSTGLASQVKWGRLVVGSTADAELLASLFKEHRFDGVMHFAGSSLVGESVAEPARYYRNNVANTLNLLDVMTVHGVRHFVFSSTAAVYGEPVTTPIGETHPCAPINPYGASKWMVERMLQDHAAAYGLNSVSLRYFNASGADPEGELGECHDPETHLIPLILRSASSRSGPVTVFGRDYPTSDGTCIRDYVHVTDLCEAHALALEAMFAGRLEGATAFNLGSEQGASVNAVIEVAQALVREDGYEVAVLEGTRRRGDPAVLVADSSLARQTLGWKPRFGQLREIIAHAWQWEKRLAGLGKNNRK